MSSCICHENTVDKIVRCPIHYYNTPGRQFSDNLATFTDRNETEIDLSQLKHDLIVEVTKELIQRQENHTSKTFGQWVMKIVNQIMRHVDD